ncbi:MAG: N-glycosylase/DNA lyase [archaeon]
MGCLIEKINSLKDFEIGFVIRRRLKEFESVSPEEFFSELCFCLLTANFQAEKSIKIQEEIGDGFFGLEKEELAFRLKELGHRFWPQRAERIVLARKYKDFLSELILRDSFVARDWLVENVKGLGMKEASHFLRNVGKKDLAIIDFHVIDLLVRFGIIDKPKSLNRARYLEIEKVLRRLSERLGMNLAELDLYLWYLETGKVLK